ncbi:Cys-tRNA(Pro) deacylase [Anaerosacchariphilus polymeriproducens]|uniref:Cys-tRNA(Pro)/Cys-tRNA(Cys) deacylase n=1 Tax=Anaerosacchariphilus polymeriproducens TaxID=1812858 RepID=A0A371AYT9_9FIRM|nr:Cys-tRNA(Pro) deacylase [Anaerosacchariphilus polymeriproducens]RDU24727.1 Cys-tRNA(Pro) deacylase [Anaerosacchariphilus polymeriproducens]
MIKTNVMRLLDKAGIYYEVKEYPVDENDLSGVHVAAVLGQSVEQVFKTLVLKGDKIEYIVCCIPVADELNLKKVANITNNKKVEMLHRKDLQKVTGYIRGGCSPIGMKKKFPTFLDETGILFDKIAVSAGVRGAQIIINPEVLCEFLEGQFEDLVKV